ncbi:hypothetical protein C9994_09260 [Marivirga lumbricoides]|uniref:Toxin-antitoxin system YwqK family antitoxin n=1 Tax=Marivirga lumbricoides TaxID=1046115 RepID=A0A2T4DQA1_9BACT|nr:hypothetical protein C9994_09260 [Marivirga lumbricoides]
MKIIKLSWIVFLLLVLAACSEKEEIKKYFDSGELKYTGNKIEGKRQGEWLFYNKSGELTYKLFYSNDSLNFRQTYINGNLAIEEELSDSIKHGVLKMYYEDGSLKALTNYEYGKEQGLSEDYYPNGKTRISYINKGDDAIDFKQYYQNGKLFVEADDFGNSISTFYDSLGNKTYDILYEDNLIVDTVKVY